MTLYIPVWATQFTTIPKSLEDWNFIKQNIFAASVSTRYIDLIESIVANNAALTSEKIEEEIKTGGYYIKGDEHTLKYILMNDIETVMAIKIAEQKWDNVLKVFCNMYFFNSDYAIDIRCKYVSYDLILGIVDKAKISIHIKRNSTLIYFSTPEQMALFKLML